MLIGLNTLGAIAGPLLATFAAFPILGLHATFAALGGAMAVAGALLVGPRLRTAASRAGLAAALAGLALSFAVLRPDQWSAVHVDGRHGEEVVDIAHGSHGIVAVVRDARGGLRIKLDNHYTLGGTGATGDARMLGHVPLLLHPCPRRAAFLGLGTGITAGAAVRHPLERIDVVELIPEVAAAARRHFAAANDGLLDDPRVTLVLGDARLFLEGARGGCDVLVGDLVVPWRAGESALYTREHFERARAALRDGGIFCQWLPVYQLTGAELAGIAATFVDVFGGALAWRGDFVAELPTVGLVGFAAPARLDPDVVDARVAALAPRLDAVTPYLADPAGLWLFLLGPLDASTPRLRAARRHSADRPWIELGGPLRHRAGRGGGDAVDSAALDEFLAELRTAPLAETPLALLDAPHREWRDAGAQLWQASRMVFDGNGEQARAQALRVFAGLPVPLQVAVLGRTAPSSSDGGSR